MGTTLTASAVVGATLVVRTSATAAVPVPRAEAHAAHQDHTWVAEQMQYGILSPEEAPHASAPGTW